MQAFKKFIFGLCSSFIVFKDMLDYPSQLYAGMLLSKFSTKERSGNIYKK